MKANCSPVLMRANPASTCLAELNQESVSKLQKLHCNRLAEELVRQHPGDLQTGRKACRRAGRLCRSYGAGRFSVAADVWDICHSRPAGVGCRLRQSGQSGSQPRDLARTRNIDSPLSGRWSRTHSAPTDDGKFPARPAGQRRWLIPELADFPSARDLAGRPRRVCR